jgi:hypothetical protein
MKITGQCKAPQLSAHDTVLETYRLSCQPRNPIAVRVAGRILMLTRSFNSTVDNFRGAV